MFRVACEAQVKAEREAGCAVAPVDALYLLNHSERVSCLILYMQTATCLDNPSRMYASSGIKKNLDCIQSYLRSGQRPPFFFTFDFEILEHDTQIVGCGKARTAKGLRNWEIGVFGTKPTPPTGALISRTRTTGCVSRKRLRCQMLKVERSYTREWAIRRRTRFRPRYSSI